jgi:hypothetical protein
MFNIWRKHNASFKVLKRKPALHIGIFFVISYGTGIFLDIQIFNRNPAGRYPDFKFAGYPVHTYKISSLNF